jgi:hypothetical protein
MYVYLCIYPIYLSIDQLLMQVLCSLPPTFNTEKKVNLDFFISSEPGHEPILHLQLFVSHHTDTFFTYSPLALALSAIINRDSLCDDEYTVPTGSAFTTIFIAEMCVLYICFPLLLLKGSLSLKVSSENFNEDHDVTTFYSLGGSRKKQRSLNDVEQRILYSYSVVQVLHVQNLFEGPVHSL